MSDRSYARTVLFAAITSLGSAVGGLAVATVLPGTARAVTLLAAATLAVVAASVAISGLVVMVRWRRIRAGGADWYLQLFERVRPAAQPRAGWSLRRTISRWLNGHDFLVGDRVVIRPLEEIERTLDADGRLDGLPFQTEMRQSCGRPAVVFASLDKIYDYGRTRRMRRLRGCLVLESLCCMGTAHGNCQARCRLIWKAAWLRHLREPQRVSCVPAPHDAALPEREQNLRDRYVCQFTELARASTALPRWGVLKELRPLAAGNVSGSAFLVACATRLFNFVQRARGGTDFPPPVAAAAVEAGQSQSEIREGDEVVVRPYEEIATTLDAHGKNRGLWFDSDMRKYCGRRSRVALRVERIIDNTTGEMRQMKTPCFVLDDVYYTGEFQSFGAQHEWLFWRAGWLRRVAARPEPAAAAHSAAAPVAR